MRRLAAWAAGLLIGLVPPAFAGSLEVSGQTGLLGEWALAATLTGPEAGAYAGPLTLTHVGMCSVDGPEEKTGRMTLRTPGSGRMSGTVVMDGVSCSFEAPAGSGDGVLRCPGRRSEPIVLSVR
ncbi:MAG TPA: hypothetical protein VE650_20145 [Acetobacteraceae bacterium]|nr:hypothetical protein [Acetobacteraceae bacterium]